MTQAGPAIPVVAVTDRSADAGPALRVAVVSDGRPTEGGPARPVIVVSDGRPTQGNEPLPVVVATGAQASLILAGPAIPVVVVSGSLNLNTPPVNTVLPVVSGATTIGALLTTTDGTWTGTPAPTFTYQWKRNGVNIGGATNNTYTIVNADNGTTLTAEVTATNVAGVSSATSAGTAISNLPANTVLPVISGTLAVGQLLSTTDGTWTNTPTGYTYQWKRNGANIGGATANTYTLTASDPGTTITVEVTATNAAGNASASSAGVAISSLHGALSVFYKLADVSDSGPNALTLTNNNVATFVPGKIGDAANLVRASTQYLSRANNALLRPDATNGFTVACWFNRANAAAVHNLVAKGAFATNNTEYILFCSNVVNRVEAFVGSGAALANPNVSTGIGALGTWNFIVLKSDGATVSLRLNNGTPVTTALAGVVSGGSGAFNIGAANAANTLDGLIDAVGFWQRALTSAEETTLWNAGAGIEWPF